MPGSTPGNPQPNTNTIMNTTTITETPAAPVSVRYWLSHVLHTRNFGSTYIHAAVREAHPHWEAIQFPELGIEFRYGGYGRSLQGGGHKYKVSARYTATGKPVPTKAIRALLA